MRLAAPLRIVRAKKGLPQEQAAEKIRDLTFRHYQRLESGEENPTLGTIESIMDGWVSKNEAIALVLAEKKSKP